MATGSSTAGPKFSQTAAGKLLEYDQFIDKQLKRTRSHVRMVDVASGLLVLLTGTLAYFLAIALVDHWLIPGGLPGWGRAMAFAVYALGGGGYFVLRVLPLLIRRINPLYAAETIERSQPTLKNSLLNFLIFRARPQGLSENVYHAVEQQAAANLAGVSIDSVVDRSKLIKIGYALAGVLAVCAFYKVLSPKDPLATFSRVVMPWADILPPTRVTINDIQPGSTKAFRGQQIKVSAEVRGLDRDAPVTLVYSTADGQTVDRTIEMHIPQDGYRHTCKLPAGDDGLQQTLSYRIVAGDARSRDYAISVVAAPTLVVDSIEYLYPDYTDLSPQKIEHQGDIKAIEGTRVIVHGVANQPIKEGGIDFNCDEHEELPLTADGSGDLATGGSASFTLALEEDRHTPTHTSYQLKFRNAEGQANIDPIRNKIEVTPDLAPEIEFLAPKKEDAVVREGDSITLELAANDPDFALAKVKLVGEIAGKKLFEKSFVKDAWRGQLTSKFRLSTKEHGIKAGDTIDYYAIAEDIKQPKPNHVETPKRHIKIAPRDAQGQKGDPQQGDGDQNNEPQPKDANQPQGGKSEDKQDGQPEDPQNNKDDKSQGGDKGDQGSEGGDDQNSGEQDGDSQKGGKSGDKQQPKQDKSNEQGDSQAGDQPQNGEKKGDQSSGKGDKGQSKPGEKSDSKQGDQQPNQQNPGDKGEPNGNAPQEAVPNDGSADGDALDKILKHQPEEPKNNPGDQKGNTPKNQPKDNEDQQLGGKSQEDNKQTGGDKGGEEKPNNKQPPPGDMQDDNSGDQKGNEKKGQEQPGQSDSKNAKEHPQDQGNDQGHEQAGKAGDKQGQNSQTGGEKSDNPNARPDDKNPGEGGKDGDRQHTDKTPSGKNKPNNKPSDKTGDPNSGSTRDKQPGDKSNQGGKGDRTKGDNPTGGKKPENAKSNDEAKGGSEEEKGNSGAGKPDTSDKKGAPEKQGDGLQKDKKKTDKGPNGRDENKPQDDAQSPSNSNRESDSKGESNGDKDGGGGSGGGQQANQPGTGGKGKNTSSEEGGGKSKEQGDGETGEHAGNQQETESKTGKSGNKPGEGSSKKPGNESGEGQKGEQPQKNGNQPNQAGQPNDKSQNNQQAGPGDGTTQGPVQGGGKSPKNDAAPPPAAQQQGGEPGGDKANLDYARKATDLALQRLKDQLAKGEADKEMLDELGWSREDLEKFVRRWEQMRSAAREDGPRGVAAKRELDDALRSLGIRPRGTTLGSHAQDDTQHSLKESRRTSPPAEYAEQYKAYTQGTARGGK